MQGILKLAVVAVTVVAVAALELVPTRVQQPVQRTQAPAEVVRAQYAQTLYKATDYSVCFLFFSLAKKLNVASYNLI